MAKYTKSSTGYYKTNIDIGRDKNGNRIRKTLYAKTVKELDAKLFDLKYGASTACQDMLFGQYAEHWFNTYKQMRSINTKAMYKNSLNTHILPFIEYIPVAKVSKSNLQNIINKQSEHPETCKKILLTLRQIFNAAIEDDIIAKNPSNNLVLPHSQYKSKRALTNDEKRAILNAELNDMQRAFINILFYTGLRREEALALTKNDFDFQKMHVSVNTAIAFDGNAPVVKAPKNGCSIRSVPLPADCVKQIQSYLSNLNTIYLFTKRDGSIMTHSAYVKFWKSILKELNNCAMTDNQKKLYDAAPDTLKVNMLPIRDLTAHIFRHNYATMLYYSNVSIKMAASLLGHSDTKMIMTIYAHLDEEREDLVNKLNNVIKLAL